MKRFLFMLCFLGLAGCHEPQVKSVHYFFTHIPALRDEMIRCEQLSSDQDDNDQNCRHAEIAYDISRELTFAYYNDQDQFGDKILALQMTIASLKQQLEGADDSTIRNSVEMMLKKKQEDLGMMLFVVAQFVQP